MRCGVKMEDNDGLRHAMTTSILNLSGAGIMIKDESYVDVFAEFRQSLTWWNDQQLLEMTECNMRVELDPMSAVFQAMARAIVVAPDCCVDNWAENPCWSGYTPRSKEHYAEAADLCEQIAEYDDKDERFVGLSLQRWLWFRKMLSCLQKTGGDADWKERYVVLGLKLGVFNPRPAWKQIDGPN
jgi:hypothetical protein